MTNTNSMPIVLVPGLVSSSRIFAPIEPALWRVGPVMVANHIRDDSMGGQPFVASLTPTSSSEPASSAAQNSQGQASQTQTAQSEGFFSSLARKVGLASSSVESTATVAQPLPVKPRVAEAKAAARTPPPKQTDKATDKPADTKQASSRPNAKPAAAADATASSVPGAPAPAEAKEGLVAGSQPIVSANSFESRFSATK